ncbi:caspase family protein [Bradyrhizobium betae]
MRGTLRIFIRLLLPIVVVAAGALGPARAQQQEKRIALVVGNGAYAKSPLATTANDAGLIAQTLQAAGFDVVGARDLDGDTMRKSFRDFIQKAQASGPGTVAMVYLAGYGVQLAGENYFIPVDSNITRDTDVPTEGLRVSDYLRQLAAIPLKANIVVLDAARAQPFIEGGQPIASGLALVEPDPNMLIAFNAAPGTVAPEEPGPYGIYAQSLAEMIRTGGLPLPEVFDRLRLRVNEASKGAQVPWNEQKISAPFSFFERGPDAPPPQTAPDQVAATRNKPIRDLGAQDAYAAVLERDTLPAYEEFLAAYPNDPMSKRVMAIVAARREAITWRRTYRNDTPEAYWSYLRRYPRGPHAGDARRRLAILTAPVEPPPSFAMIDYDVPPPPPEEIVYVDRPVLLFGDPVFGFAPPPPPPVYYLPPPPPDFVVLEPPLPVVGLFVLPQPMFVPIPVFVRPPIYVAPPPNNLIYRNIHNTTVINTVINRPPMPPPPGAGPGGRPGPGAGPGSLAPAVAGRANPVGPAVPQAVAQRAALIQQGKAPMPPSATMQPAARPGTPPATPANVAPNSGPGARPGAVPNAVPGAASTAAPPTRLPQANTLPVPGAHGGPPAPPAGAGTPPGGRPAPTSNLPGGPLHPAVPTTAAPGTTPPGRPGVPTAAAPATVAPTVTNPAVAPGQPPKPPVAQTPPAAGAPGTPPGGIAGRPVAPMPSAAREPARPQNLPSAAPAQASRPSPSPPSRPQAVARPTAPPPQMTRPAPPPRVASPPPVRAAPPVAVARPAPPPMARPAPPPQMARPAPPPPVARPAPPPPPRMAVAPPPRPAPPPPRPAAPPPAAKKCPPNQPRC